MEEREMCWKLSYYQLNEFRYLCGFGDGGQLLLAALYLPQLLGLY